MITVPTFFKVKTQVHWLKLLVVEKFDQRSFIYSKNPNLFLDNKKGLKDDET